jgi:hypothetical protein
MTTTRGPRAEVNLCQVSSRSTCASVGCTASGAVRWTRQPALGRSVREGKTHIEEVDRMRPTVQTAHLSLTARKVVDEILGQLEHREDALRGLEGTIIDSTLAYRRGRFVVEKTSEEPWSPAEEARAGLSAIYEELNSSRLVLEELACDDPNEIRIRATPAVVGEFDFASFPAEDNLAFTMTMSTVPARLLRVEMELVNLPWWLRWLLKLEETSIEFDYIRGVPVPRTSSIRILSRGIGSLRLAMGSEIEVRYRYA